MCAITFLASWEQYVLNEIVRETDQASRHHTLNMFKLPEVYGKGTTVSCSSKQDILYTC